MNFRSPSIKKLREIFGENAKEAKSILRMSREELEELPACIARIRECWHPPKTYDLRMHALNALDNGFFGVEAFQLRDGSWCDYLNSGDTYSPTLVRFRGNYYVTTCGDIAERHA